MGEEKKLQVTKEGRDEIYLVEKEPLKEWIRSKNFEAIHNFIGGEVVFIGADHTVESVLEDVDRAERQAILTGKAQANNIGHALALIIDNNLQMFDIGKITEDDLIIL